MVDVELDQEELVDLEEEIEDNADDDNIEDLGKFDLNNITIYDENQVLHHDIQAMTKNEKRKLQSNHSRVNKMKSEPLENEQKLNLKIEGLQTIVCSATLQMDAQGRIRPSKNGNNKKSKRNNLDIMEELFKRFDSAQKNQRISI